MNEELQKALADIISGALKTAESAKEFMLAELPDVVQQLLAWKMAESIAHCLLGMIMFGGILLYWRWVAKRWDKISLSSAEPPIVVVGIMVTIFGALLAAFLINLTWLQIWLAPKVYLLEYAAQLVK